MAEKEMLEGEEAPPAGTALMGAVRWAMLVAAAALAAFTWLSFARAKLAPAEAQGAGVEARPTYHCPMHPQIVSNEPGECPICHMALEPIAPARGAPPATAPASSAAPASRAAPASAPPGTAPVQLALDRVQAIGVRTAVATEKERAPTLSVTAVVAAPETGVAEVHARSAGFVERMAVGETGVAVRAGQPLVAIYSPEIYQAQAELLAVQPWSGRDGGSPSSDAARQKLRLLGMAEVDVDEVLAARAPMRAVPLYAPEAGVVTRKNAVLGAYVTPETALFEIEDLSTVWVIADVFQKDLAGLRAGTAGRFRPARAPSTEVAGKVELIDPRVDAEARTTRVRMPVRNEGGRLAPGEYGTVVFALPPRKAVAVPRDAVVDTGMATYVFVVEGEGRFAPRAVSVAGADGDDVAIDEGIAAGERVVSGATFLVDSESRLQASARAVPGPPSGAP